MVESHSAWSSPSSVRSYKETLYASKEKRNPLKNTRLTIKSEFDASPASCISLYAEDQASPSPSPGPNRPHPNSCNDGTPPWNANVQNATPKTDFCISSRLRAISDKYLKTSTNRLLAKLYRSPDKAADENEKTAGKRGTEKKRLRSFSYGTLPGLKEFQAFREINGIADGDEAKSTGSILASDVGADSASNIVGGDENEDCDSGILVSSNSSVVESCGSCKQTTTKTNGVCHFRSASQDTPVPTSIEKTETISNTVCEPWRLELTSRQKRRQRLPQEEAAKVSCPSETADDIGRGLKVIELSRSNLDDEIGVMMEKYAWGVNDAFVVKQIIPGGIAHKYVYFMVPIGMFERLRALLIDMFHVLCPAK